MRQSHKTILIWLILIVVFVSIYSLFTDSSSKEAPKKMTELRAELLNKEQVGRIDRIRVEPGARQDAKYIVTYEDGKRAVVFGPYTDSMVEMLNTSGVDFEVKTRTESSFWPQLLLTWLPFVFLFAIFFFFMRQLGIPNECCRPKQNDRSVRSIGS